MHKKKKKKNTTVQSSYENTGSRMANLKSALIAGTENSRGTWRFFLHLWPAFSPRYKRGRGSRRKRSRRRGKRRRKSTRKGKEKGEKTWLIGARVPLYLNGGSEMAFGFPAASVAAAAPFSSLLVQLAVSLRYLRTYIRGHVATRACTRESAPQSSFFFSFFPSIRRARISASDSARGTTVFNHVHLQLEHEELVQQLLTPFLARAYR